ncbi:HAD family hydrolase [Macrococcoides canis]|uniref:HAD family hydrolase n=1 Tax=Macrococcoides canis TaxID=1855823 RepID=A0A4R6C4I0_9STAP|nr:HAD family hydrolase [Macrococcus canis]TDM16364.1 HAD family hydrolase [Macrococcus canis]TDM35753.1 HAD family hydrolase [Macrococcus canis]
MVKAIIFDMESVLLDRKLSLEHFLDAQYEYYRTYFTEVQKQDFINYFITYDKEGAIPVKRVYQAVIDKLSITYIETRELMQDYMMNFPKFASETDNMKETMTRLQNRGYKIGVIATGDNEHEHYIIDVLGIKNYITHTIITEENIIGETQLIEMCRALDTRPQETLFVTGDEIVDVEGTGIQLINTKAMNANTMIEILNTLDEETIT